MNKDKTTLIVPILMVAVGAGWLLSSMGVVPDIHWVWTLVLAGVGILAFAVGGIDKVTVVLGSMFLLASCLSILRQTGQLSLDVEIPILVIAAGVLMLIVRLPAIPAPHWILQDPRAPR